MRRHLVIPAFLAALVWSMPVSASPLNIIDITGHWQNAVGGPLTLLDNDAGQSTDRIRWGAWSPGEASGYDFTPSTDITAVTVGSPFVLGTFTHHNRTIPSGTDITAVQYAFAFATNGNPGSLGTTLQFFHNETPNTPPPGCPAGTIGPLCADIVTISAAFLGSVISVGSDIYTFTLLGFSPDGVNFSSQYVSQENGSNTTSLYAAVSSQPIGTPEPASLALLSLGLGAAAAAARRARSRRQSS
jgi:PEP-CTERM motif